MGLGDKVPFAGTESAKFNRWAVVIGIVLLALIAAAVVLPPVISGIKDGAGAVNAAAGQAAADSAATARQDEAFAAGMKLIQAYNATLGIAFLPQTHRAMSASEAIAYLRANRPGSEREVAFVQDGASIKDTFQFLVTGVEQSTGKTVDLIFVVYKDIDGNWTTWK